MIEEFIAEANELVDQMSSDLLAIDGGLKRGGFQPDTLNSFFRGAHSLKGIAGVFGYENVSKLSHQMESFLDRLRLGKLSFTPEIIDLLFSALEALSECVQNADRSDESVFGSLLGRFDQATEQGDGGGRLAALPPEIEKSVLEVLTEYEEHRLRENLSEGTALYKIHAFFPLMTFDEELEKANRALKEWGEIIATLPASKQGDPDSIGFDLLLAMNREADAFDAFLQEAKFESTLTLAAREIQKPPPPPTPEPKRSPEPQPEGSAEGAAAPAEAQQTIRVATSKLDFLMNSMGELLMVKAQLGDLNSQYKEKVGFTGFAVEYHKLHRQMERKLQELQMSVMSIRMTPIAQLFDKVARVARQTAREAEKEVRFETEGRDVELDKLIIDDLSDPLMHLVRNSIDHGIEPADERAAAQKPIEGKLTLAASQMGNYVTLKIKDDGRGMNVERIREKGIERGLISAGSDPTQQEILDLVFQPGFSTKEAVTQLSGRGVGMDVVKRNIGQLGGYVHIETQPGEGSTVVLRLPITLAILQALVVTIVDHTFAIPLNSIIETVTIGHHEIQTVEKREVVEFRNQTLPLLRLWELINLPKPPPQKNYYVVVVGVAERMVGIIVENILNQQDIVVKSMGELRDIPGITGATELGNQKTVLVLDVNSLIQDPGT